MAEERQFKYTIAEGYELPSKGKIYGVKIDPQVELRSMTARDEMKRLSPSNSQFKKLADIIEGCMIEKPKVKVYDMALGDYEFLLHKLRIVTYGSKYKISVGCPHCGHVFETEADLEQLQILEFDEEKFKELQTITLPVSGDVVKLRFQTPRMLDTIEAKTRDMKRKFRDAELEFNLLVLLEEIIDEVNGNKLDPLKAEAYVSKLPARDMTKLVNTLDALNECIGLDTTLIVDCPQCTSEVKTFFRFGTEFFRPTNI